MLKSTVKILNKLESIFKELVSTKARLDDIIDILKPKKLPSPEIHIEIGKPYRHKLSKEIFLAIGYFQGALTVRDKKMNKHRVNAIELEELPSKKK